MRPADDVLVVEFVTDPALAEDVAAVAAQTFPLACPPHSTPEDVAGFINANLGPRQFRDHIDRPTSDLLVARIDGRIVGYALLHHAEPADADVRAVVTARPASEVSKMYVLPGHHSREPATSPAHRLMATALDAARARGAATVWLGVNQENVRAQRFYAKCGFTRAGVKSFDLNGTVEHDFVLAQAL